MNKLPYILVGLILFLLIAIGVTWYGQSRQSTNLEPDGNQVVTYTDVSISLPNDSGTNVTIKNFLKDGTITPDTQNPGLFFLGNTFTLDSQRMSLPPYVIVYEEGTGFFNIALLQKPLAASRLEAENYLINLLQVDKGALCGLSYTVSVPGYVDEMASGVDYRFSFCSDNIPL